MKSIHISFDPLSQELFASSFSQEDTDNIGFYVCKDYLNEGQLKSDIGVSFDQVRAEYLYKYYQLNEKQISDLPTTVKDILVYSNRMSNGEDYDIVLWMGNNELDLLGYYFLLHHLKKHAERISIINISGLPFIDKNGKLFFPKRVAELDAQNIHKAMMLKRPITLTEIEIDSDEWKELREQNADFRILAGNKKIKALDQNEFDEVLRQHYNSQSRNAKNIFTINDKLGAHFSERLIIKRALELGLSKKDKLAQAGESDNQISLDL